MVGGGYEGCHVKIRKNSKEKLRFFFFKRKHKVCKRLIKDGKMYLLLVWI